MRDTLKINNTELSNRRKLVKFVDDDKRFVGCGESFPVDQKEKDNYRSQTNRRVEFLFFDPDEIPDINCPADKSKTHKTDECPIWNEFFKKTYIDPDDLFAEMFYLKFVYFDRVRQKLLSVPEKLNIQAYQNTTNDPSKAEKLETFVKAKDGIQCVKVRFKQIKDPAIKSFHFEFIAEDSYIFTETADESKPVIIVKKNSSEFNALTFQQQFNYYDLPAKWSSVNYRTLYDGKDEGSDSFQNVIKTIKSYKPFGDTLSTADKPLVFSLDDIVLLDTVGGTQDIKDSDHRIPASAINLSGRSRVNIFTVDSTDCSLAIYKRDSATAISCRIPFARNYITEKLGNCANAVIVYFKNGFYPVGRARTTEQSQWQAKNFVVGARSAILNDPAFMEYSDMKYTADQFGSTGDYELFYFHHLYMKNQNPISYLLTFVSISFMGDTREAAHGPVPSAADVQKFEDDGIYNAIDHWNRKKYYYQEATPGATTTIVKPFYFFDEKETFRVARPVAGFNIDFDLRPNHATLFNHANIQTAQQNAVGGRSRFLAMICKNTNPATNWGPAYQWAIRLEGPTHYSLFKLNVSAGWPQNGQYTGVPVIENAESYGAHTFSHELGHATGNPDEYVNKLTAPVYLDGYPDFNQYFVAYSMQSNQTSMMYSNGAPRLHHLWFALHRINWMINNVASMGTKLSGKEFKLRLDRGAPWDSVYFRHVKAATAVLRQKPSRSEEPMHSASQHQLSATPLKRLNLRLFDVGRDESSLFNFHPAQTTEYQSVLVVCPMMSVRFVNPSTGAAYWTDPLRSLKVNQLYWAWRNCDAHFRLTGGTKDIKNIYVTFLPCFSNDSADANRNYTLDFMSTNYSTGDRIVNNAGRLNIYNDITADEVVRYMLNTASALNTAGAITHLKTWVNGVMGEIFSEQYF